MGSISGKRVLIVFFMIAFFMRVWAVAEEKHFVGDENLFVPAAADYFEGGSNRKNNDWLHPPFTYFLTQGSVKVFGNNPYGWRMANVVLGSLSIVVLFLLAYEIFGDQRVALLAALFMAIEPIHVLLSRTNFMELSPVFFFILSLYLVLRQLKGRNSSLIPAGICLGLSLASKWYYVSALGVLVFFVLVFRYRENKLTGLTVLSVLSTVVLLPLTIYLLTYYPLFKRGLTLSDLFEMHLDAYIVLQHMKVEYFASDFLRDSMIPPWKWFLGPFVWARQIGQEGIYGRFLVLMNNPPVSICTVPAVLYSAVWSFRKKNVFVLLAIILFCTVYFQLIYAKRPIFFYSAVAVLPFAYLFLAHFFVSLLDKITSRSCAYRTLFTTLLIWGLYLYPFVIRKYVLVSLYAPLIWLSR